MRRVTVVGNSSLISSPLRSVEFFKRITKVHVQLQVGAFIYRNPA